MPNTMTVARQEYPELFFGIVAPIGSNVSTTIDPLVVELKGFGYEVVHIKVTDCFKQLVQHLGKLPPLIETPLEQRYDSYIKFGDAIRSVTDNDAILAYATMFAITCWRNYYVRSKKVEAGQRVAYILNQFKRREEIDALTAVYGRQFFQISIYSKRSSRVDILAGKIAQSNGFPIQDRYRPAAEELVTRDQEEQTNEHGQRVGDIFHQADFIVDSDVGDNKISEQVKRFAQLLFGSNSISPSKDEYGMYIAKSASLRSLDLSRQVGAAIFSKDGEVISLGTNEIPKAGGGTYWCDDGQDDRDYKRLYDSNQRRKRDLLAELVKILNVPTSADELLRDERIQRSQFMDALEYGRMIHAEMSAISDAARLGRSLKNSILYTTTFPCHMCAKHIVASGISSAVFLEPYPKSLASEMHSDSIEIAGQSRGAYSGYPSVTFKHFHGVSPKRYRDLFERKKRKDNNGNFRSWMTGDPQPNVIIKVPVHMYMEREMISASLRLDEWGINYTDLVPSNLPDKTLAFAEVPPD